MDFSRLCLAYIWKSWIFFLFYPIFLTNGFFSRTNHLIRKYSGSLVQSALYHSFYPMLVVNVTYSTLTATYVTCIFASSLVCWNCSIRLFKAVGYWIRISKIQIAIEYFVYTPVAVQIASHLCYHCLCKRAIVAYVIIIPRKTEYRLTNSTN